ncbi:MAG: glycosyl hydrolase [Bacteroidia bacterium]
MKNIRFLFCIAGLLPMILSAQIKVTSSTFGSLEARQIGPAVMSGRITAIDAVNSNTRIVYVGTAGGGIWKSTTAGVSFKSVFDKYNQSIGCLVIDQKNPETVWVGTGECNMRNSVSAGNGVFRTADGGSNWKQMGLDSCERISKIAINPQNSDILYVAVPGSLWSASKHRGLYKTSDGGKTWKNIYFVDDKTGCADVMLDPKNPETIYASMWNFRRTPWSFSSGGKTSGLFKSTDGGATWKKIEHGFDGQELGRICMAISPSEPQNLYAIAESNHTFLYASTDGGANWVKKSSTENVTGRLFYFSVLMVDPTDPKRMYRPGGELSISTDGGESFKEASFEGGWVHSDHHALWIDPNNSNHLLLGTDGGVYQSLDKGNSWTLFSNLPVSMAYHVSYDMQEPYQIYTGLQDNGSWYTSSQCSGGIQNKEWTACGFGDGFWVQPDLTDPNIVYSEYQGGMISRSNKVTHEYKDIRPYELAGETKLRCNWNTPIVPSPTNPKTLYFGAQYLYRTHNKGDTWERISPDLTTNDQKKQQQEKSGGLSVDNTSAENHCTIFSICESPLDENIIWVGTDDGNLQLTTNGGKTWTNVIKNITGLPACTWVSSIDASRFDKNTVFVSFDGHATGDMKSYIYRSADLGKTWTLLSASELKGYVHKIKQDIVTPSLLFAGTECGLFISLDAGKSWTNYNANIPPVSIRDITIHPRTHDLLLATHGRGIIILDDITPIRNLTADLMEKDFSFLPQREQFLGSVKYGGAYPNGGYTGPNPPEDFVILYYMKDRLSTGDVKIEIYNKDGKLIKTQPGTKRKGINKVTWDYRQKPPRCASGAKVDFGGYIGPLIPEGTYKIKVIRGDKSFEKEVTLRFDPRSIYSVEDKKFQQETTHELFNMEESLAYLGDKISWLRDSALSRSAQAPANKELDKLVKAFSSKVDTWHATIAVSIAGTAITGEEKIREKLTQLYYKVSSFEGRPTDSQIDRKKSLEKNISDASLQADDLLKTELPKLNAALAKEKLSELKVVSRDDWEVKTKK